MRPEWPAEGMEMLQASRGANPVDVATQLGASLWGVPGSCSHEAQHLWTESQAASIIAEHALVPRSSSQPRATWPEPLSPFTSACAFHTHFKCKWFLEGFIVSHQ